MPARYLGTTRYHTSPRECTPQGCTLFNCQRMKMPKVADIVGIINKIAPPALAETWDNPGLQVGDPAADVARIMVALDPTPAVINAAISASCQLLVTHHPLIFKPLTSISTATAQGSQIQTAIRSGLSIVSYAYQLRHCQRRLERPVGPQNWAACLCPTEDNNRTGAVETGRVCSGRPS